jgi:DnaJ-class molecular chaperone
VICPDCNGTGQARVTIEAGGKQFWVFLERPCRRCNGSRIAHCCDGECAMNDAPDDTLNSITA